MKVLLSIKPKYAEQILSGSKKFEYRRTIFKDTTIKTVVLYASSPLRKVIGEFEIDVILNEELNILWEKTKKFSGIDEEYFYKYFADKEQGFAIKIKNVKRYAIPQLLSELNVVPPQSFTYLNS